MAFSIIFYLFSSGREHRLSFALCMVVKSWSLDAHLVLFTSTVLRKKAIFLSNDITKHPLKSRFLFSLVTHCVSWSSEQRKTYTIVALQKSAFANRLRQGFLKCCSWGFFFFFLNKEAAVFQILLCSNLRQETIWWWMLYLAFSLTMLFILFWGFV